MLSVLFLVQTCPLAYHHPLLIFQKEGGGCLPYLLREDQAPRLSESHSIVALPGLDLGYQAIGPQPRFQEAVKVLEIFPADFKGIFILPGEQPQMNCNTKVLF